MAMNRAVEHLLDDYQVTIPILLMLVIYHDVFLHIDPRLLGAVVQLVEYRTHNQEVPGSTHTRSTASNLEQVANLLCAQTNSASDPQGDGK